MDQIWRLELRQSHTSHELGSMTLSTYVLRQRLTDPGTLTHLISYLKRIPYLCQMLLNSTKHEMHFCHHDMILERMEDKQANASQYLSCGM